MLRILTTIIAGTMFYFLTQFAIAEEVGKGKIPAEQLATSYKQLPWGTPVWDVSEAISQLKKSEQVLWIDTRPESFYKKGTVRGAILLPYNNKDAGDNKLTQDSLAKALETAGIDKEKGKIITFCQGPKCHRSYNASFRMVTEWGYKPENVIWFRAGYPYLLKEIKNNPKLKRKAKKYISDSGVKQL